MKIFRKYTEAEKENTFLIISIIQLAFLVAFIPVSKHAPSFIKLCELLNYFVFYPMSTISLSIIKKRYSEKLSIVIIVSFFLIFFTYIFLRYDFVYSGLMMFLCFYLLILSICLEFFPKLQLPVDFSSKEKHKLFKASHIIESDIEFHDYSDIIQKYFPMIKSERVLLEELFNRFLNEQDALNNGDMDKLKDLCTDSLYDMLSQQYLNSFSKGEKHILDDFQLYAYNIQSIDLDNNTISIKMSLHVAYADYYTDLGGNFIRGSETKTKHSQYILEFVVDQVNNIICPNCGSRISSDTCDYCHTVFKDINYDFSLAKIGLFKNQTR